MPQKKCSSTKKRVDSKTRRNRRRSPRGKIYLPLNSVITLCAVIVGVCSVLLFAFSFAGKKEGVPRQVSVKIQPEKKVSSPPVSVPKEKLNSSSKANQTQNPEPKIERTEKPEKIEKKDEEKKQTSSSPKVESNSIAEKTSSIIEETKKNEEKSSAWDIPNFPQARNNAKLVFIFDDGGHNMQQLEKCVTLPFPVTVAVLPRLRHSAQAAERVRKSGNEVILHQPMQSVNLNVNPGDGAITPDMDEEKIRSTVLANIYEIWPISGLNNHEGSLITADAEKIAAVMQICSQQEIYFLDSRTNSDSKVRYVSSVMGYPYYERNIFLDNTKNRKDILAEIEKGVEFANKNGVAIMIGHVWSAEILPGILREVYPVLSAKGYKFTTVSNSGALKRG